MNRKLMRRLSAFAAVAIIVTAIAVLYACRKDISRNYIEWANTSSPGTQNIDTSEYAPGHPNVRISAIDQLRSYPAPRFREGHTLLRNVQWMSPHYFGGLTQPGLTDSQVIENSVQIQYELASSWNYYLLLPGNTKGHPDSYSDPKTIAGAWIKLANDHPKLPASVITFWGQLYPRAAGFASGTAYIVSRQLPPSHYVAGTQGLKGAMKISPVAPLDSFRQDGLTQRFYLERLSKALLRPIDLINENGEMYSLYGKDLIVNDPVAVADKEKIGIKDWDTYIAYGRKRVSTAYRDAFMSLPALTKTIYTEYGIDGHSTYRHKYSEVRKINTPINGQYYATPDFYPRWPSNWETWKGPWHGIKWITDSRLNEIALGDELFSPFVAAGWDNNEENNIRPGQWLGLLKALGVMGAEFHYTGFFNLNAPFAKPENYAWQAVMPAYSQAITSKYEDILRNSTLMNSPGYRFDTGKKNELIFVRKHKMLHLYVITGSIQPSSNNAGETPREMETSIKLNGKTLKFKIRRQGSTYVYDIRDLANPVFYQLDGWHQDTHPSRWKKDFLLEAELADRFSEGTYIRTESKIEGDYTNSVSFVGFTSERDTLTYSFEPREEWPKEYSILVRARVKGNRSCKMAVTAGSYDAHPINVNGTSWRMYNVLIPKHLPITFPPGKHQLKIAAGNGELEVDMILISPK